MIRRYLVEYLTATEGRVGTDPATSALFQALERPSGIPLRGLDDLAAIPCSTPPTVDEATVGEA